MKAHEKATEAKSEQNGTFRVYKHAARTSVLESVLSVISSYILCNQMTAMWEAPLPSETEK